MPPPPPLLTAIRQPALLYGPDGTVLAANGPAEALAGRPLGGLRPEEVGVALSLRRRDGAVSGRDEHPVARALAGEAVVDVPLLLTAADGRTLRFIGTVAPVLDGGRVTGALSIWTDVTPLAEAEAALREREATCRTIIETANEGIWEMDERFVTLRVNPTMAAMLGYRPEEMVGRPVPEFLFAEDIPEHVPRQDERSRGLRGTYECRLRHRDGSERWTLVSATPKTDGAGAHTGSFAMFVDITERSGGRTRSCSGSRTWRATTSRSRCGRSSASPSSSSGGTKAGSTRTPTTTSGSSSRAGTGCSG
jgi:PAS domain S-box-containing protein